jgi:hypothetical protein
MIATVPLKVFASISLVVTIVATDVAGNKAEQLIIVSVKVLESVTLPPLLERITVTV